MIGRGSRRDRARDHGEIEVNFWLLKIGLSPIRISRKLWGGLIRIALGRRGSALIGPGEWSGTEVALARPGG